MADFEELSRALGLKVSDRESRILFRYLDKERDNSVEFEEFRSFLKHQATEKKLEKIRKKIFKNLGKSKTKLLKETVIVYRELSESDDPPLDPVSDIVIEDGDYYDARNYNLTLLVEKLKAKDVKKTLKQLRHYKRLFNIMDENENTVIDINEFGRVMTDLIGVSPLSVSRDIFRLVDNNLDGTIKSEGIHIIADALREHFDPVIEADNKRTKLARERGKSFQETLNEWHEDGGADPRKFRMMMRGLGLHMLGESDMSTLFEELDMDTNQSVSLSQFQEFLQTTYGKELERIKEAVLIQLGDKAEVLIDFNSVFNPMGSHRALLGTADVLEELETVSPQLTMQRINTLRNWKHHFAFGDHDESDGAAIGLEDYLLFMKQTVGIRDREILKTVFELKDERDGDSEGLLTIPQINDLIQDIIVRYQTDLKNNTKRDLIDKVNSAIAEYLVNDECTEKMFKKFLKALGAKVSDRDVRIVFRYLDKDKDLTITHYEVYGFFKHANHSSQNDKIRKKIIDHWNAKDEEILEIFFAREPAHKPMLKSRQSELPNLIKGKISKTWKEHKKSEIQAKQKKKKRKSSSKKKKERDRNRIQKPIPVGGRGLLSATDMPKKESTKPPKPKSILKKPSYDRVSERSIASEKSISFEALTSFIVDDKEKIESTRQELLDIDEDPMGETRKEMEEKLKKLEEEREEMARKEKELQNKLEEYEKEISMNPEELSKLLENEELDYQERLRLQWREQKENMKQKHKKKLEDFKKRDEYKRMGLKKALQIREKQKVLEFFQNDEDNDETSEIHLETEILIEIGKAQDNPKLEYTPMLNKWNLDRVRKIVLGVMESREVYHIVDYLNKRMSNLTGILTLTAFLSTSKTNVTEGDLESCVIMKLNSLCKDLGVEPKDIIWSRSAFELDIDERSRDPEEDEDSPEYMEFAVGKCEHVFAENSMNGYMDEKMFYKCVQELNLDWSELESQTYFEELDNLDSGTISEQTFLDGMARHVLMSFNHTVRAEGATLMQIGANPTPIRELDAFMPLIITSWKDEYGFVNDLEGWVHDTEVVKSIRRIAQQNIARMKSVEVHSRARTITPVSYNTGKRASNKPPVSEEAFDSSTGSRIIVEDLPQTLLSRYQMEEAKEHLSLTTQLRSGFQSMVGMSTDKTVHSSASFLQRRSEQLLLKLETHSQSGLPNLYRLIHDGKSLVVDQDMGNLKESIYALCYRVNETSYEHYSIHEFKSMILDLVMISARFCHLFHFEVYHVDDNLFIILITNAEESKVNMFRSKLILHLQQRMESKWGLLNLQTCFTKRSESERFGIFIDRAVSDLMPSNHQGGWIVDQSKRKTEKLLYDLIADRTRFRSNVQSAKLLTDYRGAWDEKAACQAIRKLVKRGITYDYIDREGNDVLMYAAREGLNDVIAELLRQPRLIKRRRNLKEMTLMMLAIQSKKVSSKNFNDLLEYDYGIQSRDKHGRDLVVHCLNSDQLLLAEFFILKGVPDIRPVLSSMIEQDDLPGILKLHRHRGLDITLARVDPEGATILCSAAQHGALQILRHLLDISDVVSDYQGNSPLHYAALWGQPKAAEVLLEHGVDPNVRENLGETPLLCASSNGNLEICKVLVKSGASVDTADHKGTTPLIRSAAYGYYELSQFLLSEGANPELRDLSGNDALSMAKRHGHNLQRLGLLLVE